MNFKSALIAMGERNNFQVPAWLLGAYRREYIHFYNGTTDSVTRVFWLQSGGLSIDLRLPGDPQATGEPQTRYQGWSADSVWQNGQLSWANFTSLHQRDLWPEPAILNRVGLHLIEQAPSGVYLEDWLALQSTPGVSAGFKLLSVKLPDESEWHPCSGVLIVAGDWAGWVLDARPLAGALQALPEFVTRIARGSLDAGFVVHAALDAQSVGQSLLPPSGYEVHGDYLLQRMALNGREVLLRYQVDSIQTCFDFGRFPAAGEAGLRWYQREAEWLVRR